MSIGILHATGAEQINFEAEDGDWILLQSDGVPDCLEDSCRLLSLMGRRPRYDVRAESRRREGKQPAKRRSLGSDCENQKNKSLTSFQSIVGLFKNSSFANCKTLPDYKMKYMY